MQYQDIVNFLSKHPGLCIATAVVCVLLMIIEFVRLKRQTNGITPIQVIQKINRELAVVIDIRDKTQYQMGHIIDAVSIPKDEMQVGIKKLDKYKNKPLIIVCNAGNESPNMVSQLTAKGFQAYALSGGIQKWKANDMPLVKV